MIFRCGEEFLDFDALEAAQDFSSPSVPGCFSSPSTSLPGTPPARKALVTRRPWRDGATSRRSEARVERSREFLAPSRTVLC